MNSGQMGICQRQAGEAALQTHFFPTSRASQTGISVLVYKSQRKSTNQKATGSNPVGCTIKTLDELRAVEGFSLFSFPMPERRMKKGRPDVSIRVLRNLKAQTICPVVLYLLF